MTDDEARDFMNSVEIPENFDEWVRSKVYPTMEDMPKEMRRAQKISFFMAMMPKGMNWTRKQVEEYIDSGLE